jgi:hypothetical protein
MREMEGDAYRTGNVMLFRDWEDNYKKGEKCNGRRKEKNKGRIGVRCERRIQTKIEKEEQMKTAFGKNVKEGKAGSQVRNHVKENRTGREGRSNQPHSL